jgi:DNA polymerase delta subunit 2
MKLFNRELTQTNYKNLSERFYIKEKNYTRQYAPLYANRLVEMREAVKTSALKKWSNKSNYKLKTLHDIEPNEKCIIIGTLYKEMEQKPSILKELSEETISINQPIKDRYVDPNDHLILEDELQRIILIGNIKVSELCTGFVVALLGYEDDNSKFFIEDYCFKETIHTNHLEFPLKCPDTYIVLISGLELSSTLNDLIKIQLFIDFLSGDFIDDDNEGISNILYQTQRLVIAGNSLDPTTQQKDLQNRAKYLTKNYVASSVQSMKQFDEYIQQLASKIEVDIMPGEFDPSNYMMPQQPLHPAMLPKSKVYNTFHTATNPYEFEINGVQILGTSGQPVNDIKRFTSMDDAIEIMKLTLNGAHIAPTCPDTLACYPYYGKDPFILKTLPHVYFCGNQLDYKHEVHAVPSYDSSDVVKENKVHLISIPKFRVSHSCVFLNMRTLESEEYNF